MTIMVDYVIGKRIAVIEEQHKVLKTGMVISLEGRKYRIWGMTACECTSCQPKPPAMKQVLVYVEGESVGALDLPELRFERDKDAYAT